MVKRVMGGDELIAAMKMSAELLTFDEAMAALRRMGEGSTSTLWPTLNGNECYAFANAAADEYRRKMEASNAEVRGASRLAGEASSAEGATSTVVLAGTTGRKEE